MQVTITTPPQVKLQYLLFLETVDGDHGDWTVTEKVWSVIYFATK